MSSTTDAYAARQPYEEFTLSADRGELRPASAWHSLTGSPIGDELLDWPADVFALTEVILKRSEVHRFALSPPEGWVWPPGCPRWGQSKGLYISCLWPRNGTMWTQQ